MAESVPEKVDIEAVVIPVAIVEKPIGEAVAEHMRMNIVWVTLTELAALIVPERLHIGLVRKALDHVPHRPGRHLVGLP